MKFSQTEPAVPADAVGKRVFCDGERATVRYVGPVPPTAGLWLGVEWDHPDRGKHDGTHEGIQYFTCRHPKGGSFVRPAKVSFGVDFLTAVQQIYQIDFEEDITEASKWGKPKDRSLESLSSVLLSQSRVSGPGADGEIRKTTPNVRTLDMGSSLLSCWEEVAAITQQLDRLETLNLSRNRLQVPSDRASLCQAFCNLKALSLKSSDLTWPQILECAPMWPQLEELVVEDNNITEWSDGVLQTLKSLNLSRNPLAQDSVLRLGALPRLQKLNVEKTGLSHFRFDDAAPGAQTAMFPALSALNVNHNNITEWWVVDELAKLPSLVKFSCRGNQLVSDDGNYETARQMLIAKMGNLLVLNSSGINSEERKGAERDYIKMFGEEWLKAGGGSQPSSEFIFRHPRYLSLIEKHGAPEEGELKKQEPSLLKNQLLKITFVFPDDPERKPIEKKLPSSMVVYKVKGLLYRLLKVPAHDLRLTYTSPKMLGTEFEIDNNQKTLHFYSIEEGDQVLVRWS
ncbi:uncharacterized protein V6R79_012773 [Siganus canaliculatus]